MALFMQRGDEYGNTGMPPAIIEAESDPTDSLGTSLTVLAPPEIVETYPHVSRYYWYPVDADGARMLTEDEFVQLRAKLLPDRIPAHWRR